MHSEQVLVPSPAQPSLENLPSRTMRHRYGRDLSSESLAAALPEIERAEAEAVDLILESFRSRFALASHIEALPDDPRYLAVFAYAGLNPRYVRSRERDALTDSAKAAAAGCFAMEDRQSGERWESLLGNPASAAKEALSLIWDDIGGIVSKALGQRLGTWADNAERQVRLTAGQEIQGAVCRAEFPLALEVFRRLVRFGCASERPSEDFPIYWVHALPASNAAAIARSGFISSHHDLVKSEISHQALSEAASRGVIVTHPEGGAIPFHNEAYGMVETTSGLYTGYFPPETTEKDQVSAEKEAKMRRKHPFSDVYTSFSQVGDGPSRWSLRSHKLWDVYFCKADPIDSFRSSIH